MPALNSGKIWTQDEEDRLYTLINEKKDIDFVAQQLGRSATAIACRMSHHIAPKLVIHKKTTLEEAADWSNMSPVKLQSIIDGILSGQKLGRRSSLGRSPSPIKQVAECSCLETKAKLAKLETLIENLTDRVERLLVVSQAMQNTSDVDSLKCTGPTSPIIMPSTSVPSPFVFEAATTPLDSTVVLQHQDAKDTECLSFTSEDESYRSEDTFSSMSEDDVIVF